MTAAALDQSPLLHIVLPHDAPPGGIFGHKINGAAAAVLDAKIGGAETLFGAPMGHRADGGLLGALAEAFRIGHSGPMTSGPMHVANDQLGGLSPASPGASSTASIER